ncbi:hypothetical protein [Bacteroides sp.]|uniref:hypothetical protein n=1 Tax=Bacteroides sp. TaxID=29523 RepID=UPI002606C703|nr:hypothetical protein [Bacteroides sp.]MDD3039707.1 hypothetical protein [Bacteroides sp.]
MKLSEIKPGMLVIVRNGNRYKLGTTRNGEVKFIRPEGTMSLSKYDEETLCMRNGDSNYDIVQVMEPKLLRDNQSFHKIDHITIWQQEEETKVILTKGDIARRLGIEPGLLVIKDII